MIIAQHAVTAATTPRMPKPHGLIASTESQKPVATVPAPVEPSTSAPQSGSIAPRLVIELDEGSARFVQSLVDPVNQSVLRRFPNESQLAFSRGVNAYIQALRLT